jgi:cysteinyl-tRNA synthetase
LIEQLEARGFTYPLSDGTYFDTSRAPHYGELSGMRASAQHSRVLREAGKRNAADFALWKLSSSSGPASVGMAEPVGRRFSGLAHRVQRNGEQIFGRAIRDSYGRRRSRRRAP